MKTIEIYRNGQLDKWATRKQDIVPAILRGVDSFDAGVRNWNHMLDNLPSHLSKIAQTVSRELDRQAGRV